MELQRGKRRVLLLLVAILPAAVLVGLAARVFRQDKELANKRDADQRQEALEQVRRELATKLEAIKLEEVNRLRDEASQPTLKPPADSAVVFVLPIEQDRMVMPWEDKQPAPTRSAEYLKYRQDAERAEFQKQNSTAALIAYEKAFAAARQPLERCESELALARALVNSARSREASSVYHRMLHGCDSIRDDDGIPLGLYAAERLVSNQLNADEAREYVLSLAKMNRWWPPMQSYLMRALLAQIETTEAREAHRRLSAQIDVVEQMLALARDFHGVALFRVEWFAYGSEPWLVTVMSATASAPPFVMAVSSRKVAPPGASLVATHSETSMPLGERFMDVDVEWLAGRFAPAHRIPQSLYWAAFILILAATGSAGLLLMRDLNREVQTANLRSQFVASVSHELKTPLTAIRMFAETLVLGRSKNERASAEYLQTIVNESERLSRLVDNVLDFSRLERGEKIYRMELLSLADVVRAAARAMQYPLSQQGFNLALSVEPDLPEVKADADALEQAILNLLTNAMKYSGDSREIALHLERVEQDAVIEVIDHGVGIPPEEHARIFEKFYRVRSTAAVTGTGLGLTLAMHIVKAHGGRIEVKSAAGSGSTFSVFIPYQYAEKLSS